MILNRDVSAKAPLSSVYRVQGNSFEFRSNDPALSYSGDGLLKKDFQSVHRGDADEGLQAKVLQAYDADIEIFRNSLRTVGVGTNLIIQDGTGSNGEISIPMVGRTATGPDGTVGLGKQSRAAGGAYGDISASGFREFTEEFLCARDKDGSLIIFNIVYQESSLDTADRQLILGTKKDDHLRIAQEYGLNVNGVQFRELEAHVMSVPSLTQQITQVVDGRQKDISDRILTDNPTVGDYAGVDTLLYVQLPDGLSTSDLVIKDGERGLDEELLKREWTLASPGEWIERIKEDMPISPAPKRVFDNWDKVEPVLAAL